MICQNAFHYHNIILLPSFSTNFPAQILVLICTVWNWEEKNKNSCFNWFPWPVDFPSFSRIYIGLGHLLQMTYSWMTYFPQVAFRGSSKCLSNVDLQGNLLHGQTGETSHSVSDISTGRWICWTLQETEEFCNVEEMWQRGIFRSSWLL